MPESTPQAEAGKPFWWVVGSRSVLTTGILGLLYLASISWLQLYPRDVQGYVIGRDFLNFWTMGREALSDDPARFYDWHLYVPYLQTFLGTDYPYQQWSYPPQVMLFATPFGQLPYVLAYALWTALGLAALCFAARPWLADRRAAAVLLLSPAALLCFVSGQNAFFTAAALIMIYRWRDERPLLAGIILGLLTMKPQLGLLFPLILLVSRRWTLFAAAAATAVGLVLLTALAFGWDLIWAYVEIGAPEQEMVINDPTRIVQGLMPTIYMSLRILGLSAQTGYGIQAGAFVLAALLALWTYMQRRDGLKSYAMLLTATALATPYMMSYDLVIFAWLFLAISGAQNPDLRHDLTHDRAGRWLLGAVYWLPMITMALGAAGIPGAAFVFVAFALWLYLRLASKFNDRSPDRIGPCGDVVV